MVTCTIHALKITRDMLVVRGLVGKKRRARHNGRGIEIVKGSEYEYNVWVFENFKFFENSFRRYNEKNDQFQRWNRERITIILDHPVI